METHEWNVVCISWPPLVAMQSAKLQDILSCGSHRGVSSLYTLILVSLFPVHAPEIPTSAEMFTNHMHFKLTVWHGVVCPATALAAVVQRIAHIDHHRHLMLGMHECSGSSLRGHYLDTFSLLIARQRVIGLLSQASCGAVLQTSDHSCGLHDCLPVGICRKSVPNRSCLLEEQVAWTSSRACSVTAGCWQQLPRWLRTRPSWRRLSLLIRTLIPGMLTF